MRITGIEKSAKTIDKTGIPKALNETQSSVVKFLHANSLAIAIDINIIIHNLESNFQPLGVRFIQVDMILLRGLYLIISAKIKPDAIIALTTVGLILINKNTPIAD